MSIATSSPFAGKASETSGNYDPCPAGNHAARLVAIYDLGTHDEEYKGGPKPDTRKLYLAWECSDELKDDGEPHVIGQEYSVIVRDGGFLFAEKSNLRKMLESWRGAKYQPGEAIDPMAVLGRPCLLNVTHSSNGEKTYANVGGVTGLPKGMSAPAKRHEPVAYHISQGEPPVLAWMPKVWHSDSEKMLNLDEVVRISKEFTGEPIGDGKPKNTAYSAASKPSPARTPARKATAPGAIQMLSVSEVEQLSREFTTDLDDDDIPF
jgi:hypothetical protein